MPSVCMGFLWYYGFLPQSKDMLLGLTGDSELQIDVNVSVCGYEMHGKQLKSGEVVL